ncbi:hypothetical protein [Roseivirga sp. E12]|uniref:hypothetical protein n=1 Tax=Roseivirga sp. E12 TaxID=2819237 RepID=UPI001ABC53F8|nr:hypothetical protein [Roseivirga sp. E12]MBO3697623.1 hypothetical protein [Roseivirga sp. E12]
MNRKHFLFFMLLFLYGCSEFEFPDPIITPEPTADADFSKIVFIGGSRFAGIDDGALSSRGYQFSVPNLFLKELGFVSSDAIVAPRVNSENGFNIYTNTNLSGNEGSFRLFFPQDDTLFFKRETRLGTPLTYENQGVDQLQVFSFPNATIFEITEGTQSTNPYLSAFFNNSSSLLERAKTVSPSFFVLDMGFDDIFGFAKSGITGNMAVNVMSNFNKGDLLSEDLFRERIQNTVDELLSTGTEVKGLLFNIPDIIDYPFFSLMPTSINNHVRSKGSLRIDAHFRAVDFNNLIFDYYDLHPGVSDEDRRPLLDFGGGIDADRWGLVAEDETLTDLVLNGLTIPKLKQLELLDFVFYQNEQQLWTGFGSLVENPIREDGYLDQDEAKLIQEKIVAYNTIIKEVADASNGKLAIVDMAKFFEEMFVGYSRLLGNPTEGLNIDGVRLEPLISRDGIFSGDGINMNPVGNAVIINRMIEAINQHFNGNLTKLDPNNLPNTPFDIGN